MERKWRQLQRWCGTIVCRYQRKATRGKNVKKVGELTEDKEEGKRDRKIERLIQYIFNYKWVRREKKIVCG